MIDTWEDFLKNEKEKDYFKALQDFLNKEENGDYVKSIYPPKNKIFRAFEETPLNAVKVVIVGQDPYHTRSVADGLAFSTANGKCPPSLRNIFTEIEQEYGNRPKTTDLTYLAKQGVLLLNTTLTVEEGKPGSHRNRGWETFTDAALKAVADRGKPAVVLLWGKDVEAKGDIFYGITSIGVYRAPHPSPYSASKGFFGCGHFAMANTWLSVFGIEGIDWIGNG